MPDQQILKCIAHHLKPIEEADAWLDLLGSDEPSQKLAKCNLRSARLCYEAQILFDSRAQDQWWILRLLQLTKEAILIDLEYQGWSDSTSGIWLPRVIRSSSNLTFHALNRESRKDSQTYPQHIYHDVSVASTWNIYRSIRIHLNEILLRCEALLESHQYGQNLSYDSKVIRERSRSTISDLVSDICASVPFCLGTIDSTGKSLNIEFRKPLGGYLIYWPLYVAMVSVESGSEREDWLRGQLEYISNAMGIRLAQLLAHRKTRDPWDLKFRKGDKFQARI
jgi:hypothetical protein